VGKPGERFAGRAGHTDLVSWMRRLRDLIQIEFEAVMWPDAASADVMLDSEDRRRRQAAMRPCQVR
jgi:hypothetical protein